mmetsp:Transcript_21932/g.49619  ORF Transcript_21932/g.49619 Transcript_21932/m.49619 type:complete len:92 (+) Transcript_21932:1454-1729(+)|eukprot:756211-Hanusia_phi.AAC.3
MQVSLGVGTLWGGVPVEWAASHQAGSLVVRKHLQARAYHSLTLCSQVLSSFLWLLHTLRYAHPSFRCGPSQSPAADAAGRRLANVVSSAIR